MPNTLSDRVTGFFQRFRKDKGPVVVDAEPNADDAAPPAGTGSGGGGREVTIAQLKAGYTEVVDTMQSVRRHLDEQAERSDRMIRLLEGLPEVLRSLPEQNKAQTEMLGAIRANMERQTETTSQLSSAITGLTSIGETQQKTMTDLQDHLRAEDVARRELREGIGSLDETLGEVRGATESSRLTLESISQQARDRDEAIGEMFRRTNRTTAVFTAAAASVALVALAGVAVLAWFVVTSERMHATPVAASPGVTPTQTLSAPPDASPTPGVEATAAAADEPPAFDATAPEPAAAGRAAPGPAGDDAESRVADGATPAPAAPVPAASMDPVEAADPVEPADTAADGESLGVTAAEGDAATGDAATSEAGDAPADEALPAMGG